MKEVYRKLGDALPIRLVLGALAALVIPFTMPDNVSGASADGTSRSYLQSRESLGGADLLPGYEYFHFSVRDAGGERLSAHFGGWARYDFSQESGDNDVQYAYVRYNRGYDNGMIDLGRVMVFEGVAEAERMDGIYARTDVLGPVLGVSAYGGVPAETGIDTAGNDIIYGARLSHHRPNRYEIGLSALKEEKNDTSFRKAEGIDLWVRPVSTVELLGRSFYDAVDRAWSEHAYNLTLGPFGGIRLTTDASRYDYSSYLRTATTSALNVAAGLLGPDEKVFTLGEEISYAATDKVTALAQYRIYRYNQAGDASSYGAGVNYARSKQNAVGFSIRRMDGDEERLQYTQYRAYGARMLGKTIITVDLVDVAFDENVGGEDHAYSAVLAGAYDLNRSFRLGADLEYLSSYLVEEEIKAFAKIIYTFGSRIGGGAL